MIDSWMGVETRPTDLDRQTDRQAVYGCVVIGIDTNIEVIVVSLSTWEPEGCSELPGSLMRQQ